MTRSPRIDRAWYVGCTAGEVGEAALLVGDRMVIDRLADLLEAPEVLPEKYGVRSVTGGWRGRRITATAFGVGAPIAVIVLRELAALGIDVFVKIGSVMVLGQARLGDLLVAETALAPDGCTTAFTSPGSVSTADPVLTEALAASVPDGRRILRGQIASYNSFYGTMFPLLPSERPEVATERDRLASSGVLASDMETAALLTVGGRMGLATDSLCLGAVDAATMEKLPIDGLAEGEEALIQTGLDGIVRFLRGRDGVQ